MQFNEEETNSMPRNPITMTFNQTSGHLLGSQQKSNASVSTTAANASLM